MSGISINKAVYSLLSGSTTLANYVGTNISPIFVDDSVIAPFVVYEKRLTDVVRSKDGVLYDEVNVTIRSIAKNYSDAIAISEICRGLIENKSGTFEGINIIQSRLVGAIEDFGLDGFISILEFTIKCK